MPHNMIKDRCGLIRTKRINPHLQYGVLLVELILSMVIISIALTGVFTVMNLTVSRSADPVIHHQMIAIAESYLEEILAQNYLDPDTDGEATRDLFDDIDDYHGLTDTGAKNITGSAIAGLTNYIVGVDVASASLGGINALKVTVTVTHSTLGSINLVGYKSNY